MKFVYGDTVIVIAGKDRGKQGTISRVMPEREMVIVDGVNIAKKHQKPVRAMMQAGIIDKEMPLPVSNIAILCSKCGRSRIGFRIADDGTKVRVCTKCDGPLPTTKKEKAK
ncbi:MAG: 50S ribosomal protein L24 [Acidimicrobiia bacterium]|jgi:large subunit ribosomal protein L24